MSFLSWFKKKGQGNHNPYPFNDEDREASAEIRAKKKELALMKIERENELHKLEIERKKLELQQDIDELKGTYDELVDAGEEDDTVSALLKIFGPRIAEWFMRQNQGPVQVSPMTLSSTPQNPAGLSLSDEQLQKFWQDTPEYEKEIAKKATDVAIMQNLQQRFPGVTDDTMQRAIKIIRTQ